MSEKANTDKFCDLLPTSIPKAVTTDTWKGQLDFDRACTGPEHRCWLCTELTPWNKVMHGLAFELVELRPGKLRLRSNPQGDRDVMRDRATAAAQASFLVSWLLQNHRCIDEVRVASYATHPGFGKKEAPFPIRLRPATETGSRRIIRALEVEENASTWFDSIRGANCNCYKLEDLDAVGGLERLKLDFNKSEPKEPSELAKLLRRNASSIKRFEICKVRLPRQINRALRCLFSCESLKISSYHDWRDRLPSMDSVARLMHSSTALKELSICPIASTMQMSTIAQELETNTTLTKLAVHIWDRWSPEPVFTALQANTTLKELRVTHCRISGKCGEALASLLRTNTGLRVLYIGDAIISELCLIQLASALTVNTTLESLHLSSKTLPINGVAALFEVLRVNKTLKKLLFTEFKFPQELRAVLARQLTQDDSYSRVQLPWAEPDLPGLTAALTSSLPCFEEFCLPDICGLSVTGLEQLFNALASNECVRKLKVCIKGDPGEKGTALCKMLKVNRSIQCLDLAIDRDRYKFVDVITHALAENTGITDLTLGIDEVREFETTTALSYLLAHNNTATKFCLAVPTVIPYCKFVDEISQGMLQNKIIVKFGLALKLICDDYSFPFFEAVRRNRGALNRAVDFVVSPNLDRQCAEGFERFSGRPCLLKHLKKATGKTEPEALLAIVAAERYLRDNYLLITGIVRHSVKCHPAKGTQVDALNKDCWLAIVRHLKIADVLT